MANLISQQCVDFVKSFEGFSPTPYLCPSKVWTVGYGFTNEIQGINYMTEEQASKMLEEILNDRYALPIKNDLDSKGVVLNSNQLDSLTSFAYNVGVSGLLNSTLYRNICAGVRDKDIITQNFQAWSNGTYGRLEGLYRRRTAEAEMFFSGSDEIVNNKEDEDMKIQIPDASNVIPAKINYIEMISEIENGRILFHHDAYNYISLVYNKNNSVTVSAYAKDQNSVDVLWQLPKQEGSPFEILCDRICIKRNKYEYISLISDRVNSLIYLDIYDQSGGKRVVWNMK